MVEPIRLGVQYRAMWQRILDMNPGDELAQAVLDEFDALEALDELEEKAMK